MQLETVRGDAHLGHLLRSSNGLQCCLAARLATRPVEFCACLACADIASRALTACDHSFWSISFWTASWSVDAGVAMFALSDLMLTGSGLASMGMGPVGTSGWGISGCPPAVLLFQLQLRRLPLRCTRQTAGSDYWQQTPDDPTCCDMNDADDSAEVGLPPTQ